MNGYVRAAVVFSPSVRVWSHAHSELDGWSKAVEVLPGLAVVIVVLVWLWLREPDKQVTADCVEREGADVPSPRASEGHSGHVELAWRKPASDDGSGALRALDPATGEPIDEGRARLESQRFEVVDVVDVEPAALRRGDLEPGVVLLVEPCAQEADAEVEFKTADADEPIGRLTGARARRLATLLEEGRRLESMVLRQRWAEEAGPGLEVLVAERGVLPPVPDKSNA